MSRSRLLYRLRQFKNALQARPRHADLEEIRRVLSPAQMTLFSDMQLSEQAHSIDVYHRLISQDEVEQDLIVASLLHDVGKSRHPLHLWERVIIVLAKAFFPIHIESWGAIESEEGLRSWRRPFIISRQHPVWGAELVRHAGASPLTISLIRRHQEILGPPGQDGKSTGETLEEIYLRKLQELDDES